MKKKLIGKAKSLLLLIAILLSNFLGAQDTIICGNKPTSTFLNTVSNQPSNCGQLLNDLVPGANDSIIYVKVKMHFFTPNPSPSSGVWGAFTKANADTMLAMVNRKLAHLNPPSLIVPGVSYMPHSKIQLVYYGTGFYKIFNSSVYSYVESAAPTYYDNNALNIYFGDCDPPGGSGCSISVPGTMDPLVNENYILFRTISASYNLPYFGEALAHEVCHAFGLNHSTKYTFATPPYFYKDPSTITPKFGCCDSVGASDYPHETTANWGQSNNLMSQNSGAYANAYLSPHQLAVMYYNLRSPRFLSFLTPNSYNVATSVNTAFDYNVTSDETWTYDRYFKGNITVKTGKKLTVKCGLAMTHGAKIIVEKGALLSIEGGTITNISGRTWDGIYVDGKSNLSQAVLSNGMPQHQGMVKLVNGAVISHATIGIRNYYNNLTFNYGGIILAGNSSFLNNQIDVDFRGSAQYVTLQPSLSISESRFYSCNFKTTGIIGDNLNPLYHASLKNLIGVRFFGCNFECDQIPAYDPNNGYGIYSVNSKFNVDKNGGTKSKFKNLARGVFVNNNDPLRVPTIVNSEFTNNLAYGAYFMNAYHLVFQNNIIQNPGALSAWSGVYLNNCKYYTIKNNQFKEDPTFSYKATPCLEIFNSTSGAHQVYNNSFSNSYIGINAMGNNSGFGNNTDGLKMNCNDFTQTSNLYDIALNLGAGSTAPSVMTKQGETGPSAGVTNVVRNMYAATCNSNQNKWYVHSSSGKTINHGCNVTSVNSEITNPSPQPGCSNTIVNIVTINTPLNHPVHCGPGLPSGGGTSTISPARLSSMNDYILSLREDEINTGVDHHFEIQATVASKLNMFLTDTVMTNIDSVIVLLESNQGNMEDADVQTIFAYMNKGDYSVAQDKAAELILTKPDWGNLLTKIITLVQDTVHGIQDMRTEDLDFFSTYTADEEMDGHSIAQAILLSGPGIPYSEPHNYPDASMGERKLQQEKENKSLLNAEQTLINVYPNPTQNGINVSYASKEEATGEIEIRDLLGKIIYTNFISGAQGNQYIDLSKLKSGMYLITIAKNKEVIYKGKIIKEN